MLAVDTNIVVRYLARDHPEQSPVAKQLIDDNEIFLATTVLLEAEWVLRSAYRYSRTRIADALGAFAKLPTVTLEDASRAAQALEWLRHGMDFADALHLESSRHCEAFVSFDRRLIRVAGSIRGLTVRSP
jgi:predicted nucleic-acid-binding protein